MAKEQQYRQRLVDLRPSASTKSENSALTRQMPTRIMGLLSKPNISGGIVIKNPRLTDSKIAPLREVFTKYK